MTSAFSEARRDHSNMSALDRLAGAVASAAVDGPTIRTGGLVQSVAAGTYSVSGLSKFARLGDQVFFDTGEQTAFGEVIRIDELVLVKSFQTRMDVGLGTRAWLAGPLRIAPDKAWQGRVINSLAQPLDGKGKLPGGGVLIATDTDPPPAMSRERVSEAIKTGVLAIDVFTPLCAGQRIGIFAGSGVGKSTLLGMLAQAKGFDIVVIALVGERGREVREFLEDSLALGAERAIIVVATGDESPMMRKQAPLTAMTIAEYFRNDGASVLLIVDSVTRFAHASRDIALAAGEPPVARGYAPSVFSDLPKLLERAGPGPSGKGSITGIFSVLVDGDDHNDPVADSIRGTLDGHIVLDRSIADEGRYPAINILASISRLSQQVWTQEQRELVRKLRAIVARYEDTRDLRSMGGYTPGSDAELDQAVKMVPKLYDALRQSPGQPLSSEAFRDLAEKLREPG
ncbi:flagellum-specific ATP synthase [Beijerinckia sp. GAS462]|nr:flagellum-specific ATP synthase [Beijerinckia sp. GAS462]SED28974.1 flagellum-specific ATP synthase [Beijerinckia sp. 28-YEA-48]